MATKRVFLGYAIKARYAIPVPPGMEPTWEEVTLQSGVTSMATAFAALPGIYTLFDDIRKSFAEFSPFAGYSPFGLHVEIVPLYQTVEG